jgi:hypothetical protein
MPNSPKTKADVERARELARHRFTGRLFAALLGAIVIGWLVLIVVAVSS